MWWDILEIEYTTDENIIKEAYARLVKLHHVDDDPDGFMRIKDAYKQGMANARLKKSYKREKVYDVYLNNDKENYDEFVNNDHDDFVDKDKEEPFKKVVNFNKKKRNEEFEDEFEKEFESNHEDINFEYVETKNKFEKIIYDVESLKDRDVKVLQFFHECFKNQNDYWEKNFNDPYAWHLFLNGLDLIGAFDTVVDMAYFVAVLYHFDFQKVNYKTRKKVIIPSLQKIVDNEMLAYRFEKEFKIIFLNLRIKSHYKNVKTGFFDVPFFWDIKDNLIQKFDQSKIPFKGFIRATGKAIKITIYIFGILLLIATIIALIEES